ncbi:MAG: VCBS repeat-containing protein [Acidobacteria bacterium]|nr:VCBS repeat-containing protein [Acidobacteriota bacterium]
MTLQTIATGKSVVFRWGGSRGFILVPGDYDGDGYDEIGVFNRGDLAWYWRQAPDGPISTAAFGSRTGIPVPYDYNHDGRLDLAYWEPREGKIYVSFSLGRSVDRIVQVPPHSIPAFVNMY